MTQEEFDAIPEGQIFATGFLPNSPEGLYMTESGGQLRWIAKKGFAGDWTIYCHWESSSIDYITHYGDKVTIASHILKCLPGSEEIMKYYRY